MSVDSSTYIGPFILVDDSQTIPTIVKNRACENINCKNHKIKQETHVLFCNACGSKLETIESSIESHINFDVYEESKSQLTETFTEYKPDRYRTHRFFIPNINGYGTYFDSGRDNYAIEINETELVYGYNAFLRDYEKDIERINLVFGKDRVMVKWGILNYMS